MSRNLKTFISKFSDTSPPSEFIPSYIYGKYCGDKETFDRALSRCIWMTYRSHFRPFPNSDRTSDKGWGCTLRSAQMLLARAMVMSELGNGIIFSEEPFNEIVESIYREIIRFFLDGEEFLLSIHSLVSVGSSLFHHPVGEWYGPSSVANVIQTLMNTHRPFEVITYIAFDNALYLDKFETFIGFFSEKKTESKTVHQQTPRSSIRREGSSKLIDKEEKKEIDKEGKKEIDKEGKKDEDEDASKNKNKNKNEVEIENESESERENLGSTGEQETKQNHKSSALQNETKDNHSNHKSIDESLASFVTLNVKSQPKNETEPKIDLKDYVIPPVLLLIPCRLGIEKINPSYFPALAELFKSPYFVGIIGGSGGGSHFFVAHRHCEKDFKNSLLYFLDPHTTQRSSHDLDEKNLRTYFAKSQHCLKIKKLDPSMTLGFLFTDVNQIRAFQNLFSLLDDQENLPFFIIDECPFNYIDRNLSSRKPIFQEGESQYEALAADDFEEFLDKENDAETHEKSVVSSVSPTNSGVVGLSDEEFLLLTNSVDDL